MRYDLVGRKAILGFLKLTTWRDVMTRAKRGLPVIREPGNGRWLAVAAEIEAWLISKK